MKRSLRGSDMIGTPSVFRAPADVERGAADANRLGIKPCLTRARLKHALNLQISERIPEFELVLDCLPLRCASKPHLDAIGDNRNQSAQLGIAIGTVGKPTPTG